MTSCEYKFYLRRDEIKLRIDYPRPDEIRGENLEFDWGYSMEIEVHSGLELTSLKHGLDGSTQSKQWAE
jgi:hypothetical protein